MSRPRAFVWGASGHGKVVADAALREGRIEVVGFVDELHPERKQELVLGLPIWGGAEALVALRAQAVTSVLLGIGDCAARLRVARRAEEQGFLLETVVHPHSCLASGVTLGEGSVVMAGVVVNAGSRVGRAVVLNTACSIDHDCVIGDGAHISPGAHLAGAVVVGQGAWLGIGSSVIQGLKIGARSVVGAGAAVVRSLPDGVVAYGVPARVRRNSSPR